MYLKSVGRNSTLILGVTPDTAGMVPKADSMVLASFGNSIRKEFQKPLAAAKKGENVIDSKNYLQPNCLVLKEDIQLGERIRKYVFQARVNGKWETITTGESVGNKRLQSFSPITSKSFRLVIEDSVGEPFITSFQLFSINYFNMEER